MTVTRIVVTAASPRARVELAVGALAPRLVSRDRTRAHIALTAAGMTLLGGDHVHIEVAVGPGCTLEIEDVGGTVAYPGERSSWTLEATIGTGGTLVWRGLPFVVADGADVERRTSISLAAGAAAVLRETLVLGRHRERGGHLTAAFEATDPDGPILIERLEVEGSSTEPGVLGDHRVLDAVIAVGFDPETQPGDLVFEGPGAMSRRLADDAHSASLDEVWAHWADQARSRVASARAEHVRV